MKKTTISISQKDPKRRSLFFRSCLLSTLLMLSAVFIFGSHFVVTDYKEKFLSWGLVDAMHNAMSKKCEAQCRPEGTEALPKGIVSKTSDFVMQPLWGPRTPKFLSSDFVVMLFLYDGNVNDWRDLEWSGQAIHVSAMNQTKWWYAKRFLHPDIVSEYAFIFLWDEDLGIENFNVGRYLSIIKKEGLQISQPALDPDNSEVHHDLTARDKKSEVHRNLNKTIGGGRRCDENSTDPPCTGFVEMTAPVFSRASWRCVWHMIQTNAEEQDQAAKNTSLPTLEQLAPSQSSPSDPRTEVRIVTNFFPAKAVLWLISESLIHRTCIPDSCR
ncbi:hypothetical protein ACLB2K_011068 [Fragaria x ananassa]